jgi:stage III sporulation protein AH
VVKRQTVWLSTMMVLSLMLIGYYTMNGSQNQGSDTSDATITTTAGDNGKDNTKDSSKTQAKTDENGAGQTDKSTHQTTSGTEDWFISQQTQVNQQLTKMEDTYKNIITNTKSPNSQVAHAQEAMQILENVRGGILNAHDAIVNEGFKDCVLYPVFDSKTGALTKVNVYVKADKLSADQAVKVMNVVHQQLNIDLTNISVQVPKTS